jgi:hypothetical protein
VREELEAVAWKNEDAARALEMPPLTRYGGHIFQLYLRMAGKRSSGAVTSNPIHEAQIIAWQNLYGIRLRLFVVDLIFEIDQVFRRAHAAQLERNRPAGAGQDAGMDAPEP